MGLRANGVQTTPVASDASGGSSTGGVQTTPLTTDVSGGSVTGGSTGTVSSTADAKEGMGYLLLIIHIHLYLYFSDWSVWKDMVQIF
jgi:hypothetical protein